MFGEIEQRAGGEGQAGGAGGGTTWKALEGADRAWEAMRKGPAQKAGRPFVTERVGPAGRAADFDVVVCGGTLGIFFAAALQAKGIRTCVIERGPLTGRSQEWNISREELGDLVASGVMTAAEVEAAINIEFNPNRVAFHEGAEVWTRDVLNIGVSPVKLVGAARANFEAAGGVVMEGTAVGGVEVRSDVATVDVGDGGAGVTARLIVDCMGHASPIVRQYRAGQRPDGVCLVVGTVGSGYVDNDTSDIIATASHQQPAGSPVPDAQIFWEAFPAGSGETDRTTYMFSYMDADASRPSLAAFFELYWDLLPGYQGVRLEDIEFKRALFGFFPTYRDSPIQTQHGRVLQIGDASGIQSPLSFGGFGALLRHLSRLSGAVERCVREDLCDRDTLNAINAYSPGLSAAWLFQR